MKTLARFLSGTLRGRLILGVAVVHALMMTLFIGDLTLRQRAMLLERQGEEATALSQALATSAAGWIAADDVSGLQELVDAQRRYPEVLFAILGDRDGLVLADTGHSRRGLYMLDLPREARQTVLSSSPSLVDVAVPALIGGRHVGWARVGLGQKAASAKLAEITRNGIVYALAAILIGSALAWFMGYRITHRLHAVMQTMEAVRAGNRLARSSLTGADEAAVMAREFNHMLDQVVERDAELREKTEELAHYFAHALDLFCIADTDGYFRRLNPVWETTLGIPVADLEGRRFLDFVHPDDLEATLQAISRLSAQDEVWNFTNRYRNQDGEYRWIEWRAFPSGQRIFSVARDITERRLAEERLAERVTLAELSADIGCALTATGELRDCLQKCAQALVSHLKAALARVWTFLPAENLLELQASAGMYTTIEGSHHRVPLGHFKIGLIALERKPHLTNEVIGDPRIHDQAWAESEGLVSFAGHPLIIDEQLVGVMAIFSRAPLTETTSKALASVSNQMAVGIERKRTEAELHKLNEELEKRVKERTTELEEKNLELERMNRLFVGRELRMVELKERIRDMESGPGGRSPT